MTPEDTIEINEETRLDRYTDEAAAMRAMLALDAGQLGSWEWDIASHCTTGDPFFAQLFHLDYDAQPWPTDDVFGAIHPEDLDEVQQSIEIAMRDTGEFAAQFRELRIDPDTGAEIIRWLDGRGRVTKRGEDGSALTMIGVTRDITAQKAQERRLEMLAGEMDHRVQNAYAVIKSLINLGQRTGGDKKSFADTLKTQVQAMADAHAITARLGRMAKAPSSPVPIFELVRTALAPWTTTQADAGRIEIDGDTDVAISPIDVSALAMLVYELATNAAKYGALSDTGQSLHVHIGREDDGMAVLRWSEEVRDRAMRAEAETEDTVGVRSGFGSMLIQHCVSTLKARVKRELRPEGLLFELHLPVVDAETKD